MEAINLTGVLKIVSDFGILGLVIFMWWSDNKRIWNVIDQHKKDITIILERYQHDMTEQRDMYKEHDSLCRDFTAITKDLRDIVTLNIQSMTEVKSAIAQNEFCPVTRVSKKKAMRLFTEEEIAGG
jgi:hypothetical protein